MLATQASEADDSKTGLGFTVRPLGNDIEISHTGDNAGFKTYLVGFRDSGKGAVVMTNSQNGGPLMLEIMRSIAKAYDWPDITPEARAVLNELYPVAADNFIFFCAPGSGSLAFTRDAGGQVDGLTINIGGATATIQKK